ncbi:hypothetical protein [Pedobacter sp. CFBP9032]|uniref:hypothetical protein n=1 Tax=Pedobacter sp. CFBP9032 TaxID=3096539 RepID=UPI002A6AC2A8|nr:hypothetical protein [Pedobacter sp. CFBP9032]MDY0907684.1 hypothetical protein [Pedobacter sp. CFBP9032]
MDELRFGKIVRMDNSEKYGVILDNNCQDIHFILINLTESIKVNDQVSFEIDLGEDGLIATKVSLI